jgi:hypothetical protein
MIGQSGNHTEGNGIMSKANEFKRGCVVWIMTVAVWFFARSLGIADSIIVGIVILIFIVASLLAPSDSGCE